MNPNATEFCPMAQIEFTIARIEFNNNFFELYVKNNVALLSYPRIDRIFPDTLSIRQILYECFGDRKIYFEGGSIDSPVSERPLCNIIVE
jgi:hypothetical protein